MKMGNQGGTGNKFSSVRIRSKRLRVIYEGDLSNITKNGKTS
jgi:hypothetical protein